MSLKVFIFALIAFKFAHKNWVVFLHSVWSLRMLSFLPRSACFFQMLLACKAKAFGIYWKTKISLNLFIFTCCFQDENTQESNSELQKTFFFKFKEIIANEWNYVSSILYQREPLSFRQSCPGRNLKSFLFFFFQLFFFFTHKSCNSLRIKQQYKRCDI